jgi:hypothetical protein
MLLVLTPVFYVLLRALGARTAEPVSPGVLAFPAPQEHQHGAGAPV